MKQPDQQPSTNQHPREPVDQHPSPLLNYTLATVCPACDAPTFRLACKVRCPRCGFMWDCSEL